MKTNMPVTNTEVVLKDSNSIVSTTDLKGIITSVNHDFVEISGFSEAELLGNNHNIVRHPDMPPAAFEDLWNTVKAGRPWSGIVKNRCKSGDFYWVEANVTPLREHGKIIGYMSVRSKPTRKQIDDAATLYRQINEGKAPNTTLLSRFNVMKNMNIMTRLTLTIGLLALALAFIGFTGLRNAQLAEESLKTVYNDRVVPLQQLKIVADMYAVNIVDTAHKTRNGNLSWSQGIINISEAEKKIDEIWKAYISTFLVEDEKKLVAEAQPLMEEANRAVSRLKGIMQRQDAKEIASFTINELYPRIDPISDKISKLVDVQLVVSKAEYESASARYEKNRMLALTMIPASILAAITFGFLLMRAIRRPLDEAYDYFVRMSEGDLNVKIEIKHQDEVSKILEAAKSMQIKLSFDMNEAKRVADENLRVKIALDNVSTGAMIADNNRKIVYVNGSVHKMLKSAESDIRKMLPSFDADKLVGANIDTFHKNPAHQAGMLAKLNASQTARIEIGGRTLQVIANPVMDAQGNRLGSVAEWLDMTEELAVQERERKLSDENLRVKIALDNVSTNVMMADNDLNIIYMNKSIVQMLSNAEADLRKVLPTFNVSKLMGANIDQFHKNPAHQRGMLGGFTNNYKAQISVAGRTFSLSANPVINDKNERLGSVVEWTDRTIEVAVENEVAQIVEAASLGDLSKRIEIAGKDGFFRSLSEGINQMVSAAELAIDETVSALERISNGDMTQRIDGDYEGSYGVIKDNANLTIERLTEIVGNIKVAADSINTAAKEIAAGNTDLSQRTEEQASSLEETASSMEELASTVKQNAENAKQANQMAAAASGVAVRGGAVVGEVVNTMSAINESSRKIVDIISVIDGIAFQTNILALNAAVEAARAGEQGRGFAVVAGEVRNLAQRSAAAAKEIKQLISDSVEKVEGGTKLVENAGATMDEIVTSVKRVTDIMAEITAASVEQSSGIDQVNQAVTQMDEVTQQNAALVEEAAAAAESLEEQAQALIESISIFKISGPERSTSSPQSRARALTAPIQTAKSSRKPLPLKASENNDGEWEEF